MTRYILHIGLHKTGTSSLQAYLSARRHALLEHGIDFPLAGRTPHGSQAHRHVVAVFRRQRKEYPVGFAEHVPGGLTDAPCMILSSEDFYFCLPAQIEEIGRRLGHDAKVICYLREPVSHLVSMYKEHLKRPVGESLPQFAAAYETAMQGGEDFSYYSYERNLSLWRRHFQVMAAPYRREGLIGDFLGRCGIELHDPPGGTDVRENTSLPDHAVMLQLALNRALLAGRLPHSDWSLLRRLVVRAAKEGKLPDVSAYAVKADVDMWPFLSAFRAANPQLAKLAEASAETIRFWDSEHLPSETLVDIARQHFGSAAAKIALAGTE